MTWRREDARSLRFPETINVAAIVQTVRAQRKRTIEIRYRPSDMAKVNPKKVRVEITEEILSRLLANEQVCAADFRCLDCKSKQCLWRLCLQSCTGKVGIGDKGRFYKRP
ncbi:MAG: hypothetical protein PVH87_19245 [Desulfobacteraceae bacterium]|jgi:hypothetical protein